MAYVTQVPVGGCFFVVWLMLIVGMIAGYVIFLVAMWRISKAHEQIAETLSRGISLPNQHPRSPPVEPARAVEPTEPSGPLGPAECTTCQTTIPPGETECPHCGAPRAGSQ